MKRVVEITAADLRWSFPVASPQALCPGPTLVDPFPCYPHDVALVRKTLKQVEQAVKIDLAPKTIYVLHHEPLARTNGWATPAQDWDDKAQAWLGAPGHIVLGGKRIPPHPAVTRYVVAHEYGHHVEFDLLKRQGKHSHEKAIQDEYAELRGLGEECRAYGGGQWHSNVGELLANDFRILVCGVEEDYWPHPGFRRPERVKGLLQWWSDALAMSA